MLETVAEKPGKYDVDTKRAWKSIGGVSIEGILITKAVAAEHGIRSLDQINGDPGLAALFDTDGDGLAEVHGCPEAWTTGFASSREGSGVVSLDMNEIYTQAEKKKRRDLGIRAVRSFAVD